MKKTYIAPTAEMVEGNTADSLLNAVSSDYGIEFGGTDDAGNPATIESELDLWY